MCFDGGTSQCGTQTGNSHSHRRSQLTFFQGTEVRVKDESWNELSEEHRDPQGLLGQAPAGTLGSSRNSDFTGATNRNQESPH